MTYDQYIMEHGDDDRLPHPNESEVLGVCAQCREDILYSECFYVTQYDELLRPVKMVHKECLGDFIRDEYDDEELAEILGYEKHIGG